MTRWLWFAGASVALAIAMGAGCDGGTDATSVGAGGQGGTTTTSTSGAGGFVPDCEPVPDGPPSDGSCVVLTTTSGTSGVGGAGGAMAGAGGSGGGGGGASAPVGAEVLCNPVAGGDCADGEACDVALQAGVQIGLRCAPPPNRAPVCAPCDPVSGPYCVPGATCFEGTCRRFCCIDDDCPSDTTCSTQVNGTFRYAFSSALGLCL